MRRTVSGVDPELVRVRRADGGLTGGNLTELNQVAGREVARNGERSLPSAEAFT